MLQSTLVFFSFELIKSFFLIHFFYYNFNIISILQENQQHQSIHQQNEIVNTTDIEMQGCIDTTYVKAFGLTFHYIHSESLPVSVHMFDLLFELYLNCTLYVLN